MAKDMEEVVQASAARLEELKKQLDAVTKAYQEGKISLEDYEKKSDDLNKRLDNLNKGMKENQHQIDATTKKQDEAIKKNKEYHASWEKVGATANTALGLLSAGLKDTNPALSSALGSVQKLIPNLTELGNASEKAGGLMKGMLSPAGFLTLITLVTTLLTNFDDIGTALGFSSEQLENFKNKAKEVITKVVGFVSGLGNAIITYIVTPYKTLLNSFKKVIKGDFKGAWTEIKEGFKKQFSDDTYKAAFKSGKEIGTNIANGILSKKKEVAKAGKELAESTLDELLKLSASFVRDGTLKKIKEQIADVQKQLKLLSDDDPKKNYWVEVLTALSKELTTLEGLLPRVTDGITEVQHVVSTASDGLMTGFEVGIGGAVNHIETFDEKVKKVYEHLKKYGIAYLDSVGNLTSGLADMLESDEKNSKKNAKKIKNLRIATATIDMLSGAIKAFTQAQELGPIAGPIVGGINAAAVTAMGIANINKIKSTDTESGSTANVGTTASVSYSVPQAQQVYVQNDNLSNTLESIDSKIGSQQTVLVLDDFNKVNDNMVRVKTQASF